MKTNNYWPAIVSTGLVAALLLAAALPSVANDSKKQRNKANKQTDEGQSQTPTPTPAQWNKTAGDAQERFSVGFDGTKSPTPERQVYHPGDANDPNIKKETKKNASGAAANPKTEDWLYLNLSPTPTPTRSVTHPAKPEKVTGKGKPGADESSTSGTEDPHKKHKKNKHHHHDDDQNQGND